MSLFAQEKMMKPVALVLVVGAALIAPLLGLDMLWGTGYHDTQRWIELVVFACVAVLFLVRLFKRRLLLSWCKSVFAYGILIFGFLGLISAVFSDVPAQAFFEIGVFFFLFLIAWMIASEIAHGGSHLLGLVLLGVVVGCVLYIFKSLVAYSVALYFGSQPDPGNFIPGFDSYRFFNHGQTITLPLIGLFVCLFQRCRKNSRNWIYVGWFTLSMWWMLLFVSAGRGTLTGLAVALLGVGFLMRKHAWPWLRTMLFGAALGLIAYAVLYIVVPYFIGFESFGYMGRVLQRSVNNFASSRDVLWSCALQMIYEDPWLGAGPQHYAKTCASLGLAAHPHNWVLQVVAEWGFPAFFCLCVVIFFAIKNLCRQYYLISEGDSGDHAILACWIVTFGAILIDGLVSGLIVMPVSQLWLAVFIGLAWGWVANLSSDEPRIQASDTLRICLAGVTFFVAGLLIIGAVETRASAETAAKTDVFPFKMLRPRAWGHGFFE